MTLTEPAPSADKPQTSTAVFHLIYKSRSRVPAENRETELGNIFSVARRKNTAQGITGALLLYDDWFAQTLEGDEGAVRKIFAVIEKDDRHDAVEVREQGVVDARVFARWSMAKVGEHGEPDIPLIATKNGVAEAAARGSTPEQERVLNLMRTDQPKGKKMDRTSVEGPAHRLSLRRYGTQSTAKRDAPLEPTRNKELVWRS